MFLRCLTITLMFAVFSGPTALQAQASQTTSLTLSVTIAETAATPQSINPVDQWTGQAIPVSSPHVYAQLTTRDQRAVLSESYVMG